MDKITISNLSFYDKDYFKTFALEEDYKFFSVSTKSSTLVSYYKELLQEVIENDVTNTFIDRALTEEETQVIQSIFSQKIDENISQVEISDEKLPHRKLEWKNKVYDLNLSLTSPMNRRIWDFYTIVEICKECLERNKPMYLSIE